MRNEVERKEQGIKQCKPVSRSTNINKAKKNLRIVLSGEKVDHTRPCQILLPWQHISLNDDTLSDYKNPVMKTIAQKLHTYQTSCRRIGDNVQLACIGQCLSTGATITLSNVTPLEGTVSLFVTPDMAYTERQVLLHQRQTENDTCLL